MKLNISKTIKISLSALMTCALISCSKNLEVVNDYPDDIEIERRNRAGRVTGNGFKLFGGSKKESKKKYNSAGGSGIGVNSYLWKATLDTLSFMPLASADPFGGVIITDWYENTKSSGERFKANVLILDSELKTDALKVSVFKQAKKAGEWVDVATDPTLRNDVENKILAAAREYKYKSEIE